jgi:hypothetical protein
MIASLTCSLLYRANGIHTTFVLLQKNYLRFYEKRYSNSRHP